MGGFTGNGISMPSPSYGGMGDALGNGLSMGGSNAMTSIGGLGNGITAAPGGGISYSPSTSMDMTKMADALRGFGSKKNPYDSIQTQNDPHNRQQDYQQYLNAFNAQNKG